MLELAVNFGFGNSAIIKVLQIMSANQKVGNRFKIDSLSEVLNNISLLARNVKKNTK